MGTKVPVGGKTRWDKVCWDCPLDSMDPFGGLVMKVMKIWGPTNKDIRSQEDT